MAHAVFHVPLRSPFIFTYILFNDVVQSSQVTAFTDRILSGQ